MSSTTKQIVHGAELAFDEGKHAYTWNGSPVPGVTTILKVIDKPALVQWSANMCSDYWRREVKSGNTDYSEIYESARFAHRKKMEASGSSGTNVHAYAECFLKKLPLPELETDAAKRGVEAFHKWYDSHKIKLLASERRVFSKQHYYAGTCDLVAEIDGELSVGDFKTGSGIYPEMRFQTAAYQQALEEEKEISFPVRWIIRFDKKTGKFEAKEFRDFTTDFRGFIASYDLHKVFKTYERERDLNESKRG